MQILGKRFPAWSEEVVLWAQMRDAALRDKFPYAYRHGRPLSLQAFITRCNRLAMLDERLRERERVTTTGTP